MKPHIQQLIQFLGKNDLAGILQAYLNGSAQENFDQLGFIYQQALKNEAMHTFYQELSTSLMTAKGMPDALIPQINSLDALMFFSPILKENEHFKKTDPHGRNALHYLLVGKTKAGAEQEPPFNYLRSLMLFESNEVLHEALGQRDERQLTPLECYLSANTNLTSLPDHEFTALLALMEIESKMTPRAEANYPRVLATVRKMAAGQSIALDPQLQRLVLTATYYGKSIGE